MPRHFLILTLLLAALADPLHAYQHGTPAFTAAERGIIERNAALLSVVGREPWAVRKVLDALASIDAEAARPRSPGDMTRSAPRPAPKAGGTESVDPKRNPDLDRLQRASPEALHDLFLLLQQAGGGKPQEAR